MTKLVVALLLVFASSCRAGLETYENGRFGFSFAYPNDMSFSAGRFEGDTWQRPPHASSLEVPGVLGHSGRTRRDVVVHHVVTVERLVMTQPAHGCETITEPNMPCDPVGPVMTPNPRLALFVVHAPLDELMKNIDELRYDDLSLPIYEQLGHLGALVRRKGSFRAGVLGGERFEHVQVYFQKRLTFEHYFAALGHDRTLVVAQSAFYPPTGDRGFPVDECDDACGVARAVLRSVEIDGDVDLGAPAQGRRTPPVEATSPPATASQGTPLAPGVVPRVMFWPGKVNQHVDPRTGAWQTDPGARYGANVDKLAYCRLFYPATVEVVADREETIDTWRNAGNTGAFTTTAMAYRCKQPGE